MSAWKMPRTTTPYAPTCSAPVWWLATYCWPTAPMSTWRSWPAWDARGVFFVLRPKSNMLFATVKKLPCKGQILRDALVRPAGVKTAKAYPASCASSRRSWRWMASSAR